jgi:hypothetical protein
LWLSGSFPFERLGVKTFPFDGANILLVEQYQSSSTSVSQLSLSSPVISGAPAPTYIFHIQLLVPTSYLELALSSTTATLPDERNPRIESLEGINHNSTNGDNTHQNPRLYLNYDTLIHLPRFHLLLRLLNANIPATNQRSSFTSTRSTSPTSPPRAKLDFAPRKGKCRRKGEKK